MPYDAAEFQFPPKQWQRRNSMEHQGCEGQGRGYLTAFCAQVLACVSNAAAITSSDRQEGRAEPLLPSSTRIQAGNLTLPKNSHDSGLIFPRHFLYRYHGRHRRTHWTPPACKTQEHKNEEVMSEHRKEACLEEMQQRFHQCNPDGRRHLPGLHSSGGFILKKWSDVPVIVLLRAPLFWIRLICAVITQEIRRDVMDLDAWGVVQHL